MNPCKISRESLPVKREVKSLSLPLSSSSHLPNCYFILPTFTSFSIAFKYLAIAQFGGISLRLFNLLGRLLKEMAILSRIVCKYCTPLFFKWRGSTTALSQSFPINGSNSCLDFFPSNELGDFSPLCFLS